MWGIVVHCLAFEEQSAIVCMPKTLSQSNMIIAENGFLIIIITVENYKYQPVSNFFATATFICTRKCLKFILWSSLPAVRIKLEREAGLSK